MPSPSRTLPALLLLALAALPAAADPAAEFDRLIGVLPGLDFGAEPEGQIARQAALRQVFTGTWIAAGILIAGGRTFPDAETIATVCERVGLRVEPVGSFGFRLARTAGEHGFTVDLHYAGGSTYLASTDPEGQIAHFFNGRMAEELGPDMVWPILTDTTWQGSVSLIAAGEDLVIVLREGRPADLMVRCP